MPLLANAKKALRVAKRKNVVNTKVRSQVKTATDKARKQPTATNLSSAFSSLDKAVKNNIIHKNKAARVKQQLTKLVPGGTTAGKAVAADKKTAVKKSAAKTAVKAPKAVSTSKSAPAAKTAKAKKA